MEEGRAAGHCLRVLHTQPVRPPTTQMSKLRLQEQVALVAQLVCHPRERVGCPLPRVLWELGAATLAVT